MAAVRLGITLIVLASVGLLTHLTGLLPFDSWPFGQSALRTLAEVAVLGCLLAAIGYWDE